VPRSYKASSTIYGSGADGTATISSDTTLTRDYYYQDLTINSGKVLQTGGFRLFVKGTLTVNGTIRRAMYSPATRSLTRHVLAF
jgi:hypothetical protein